MKSNTNQVEELLPIKTLQDDSDMASMVMHRKLSTDERTIIENYLQSRPELRRWFESESGRFDGHTPSENPQFVEDTRRRTSSLFAHVIQESENVGVGKSFTDMLDGEALAYAVGCKRLWSTEGHEYPSMNAAEASYDMDHVSISSWNLKVLCARWSKLPILSYEVRKRTSFAYLFATKSFDDDGFNLVWSDEDVLIRTACEYDHADMMTNILRNTYYKGSIHPHRQFIDSDYLNRVLLAPRPAPIEVDEDTWHRMSVKLTDEIRRRREESNDPEEYSYSECVVPAFHGFIADDVNELTFIETVWDFFNSINDSYGRKNLWLQEPIEPKIFDYLRTYGSTFTRQLLNLRFR